LASSALLVGAVALTPRLSPTPEPVGAATTALRPLTKGPLASAGPRASHPAPALAATSVPVRPVWRPAGLVLKRRTAATPSVAMATDSLVGDVRETLTRWHRINTYVTRYRIKPDLARRIYDAAIAQGIEPELAFRLVRVESVFDPDAVSPVGALGLTQLMLGTARGFEPNVTREQLLDPDVNLRIGLRYLRALIRENKGDLKLALLVYNRGPVAVKHALSLGLDPTNGYESLVTKGYRGRGVLD
jgi:soluble lytic murein transglycosylase-like protein